MYNIVCIYNYIYLKYCIYIHTYTYIKHCIHIYIYLLVILSSYVKLPDGSAQGHWVYNRIYNVIFYDDLYYIYTHTGDILRFHEISTL